MRKDTDYAFPVAQIRAREPFLLSSSVTEQLIAAKDEEECLRILSDHGWKTEGLTVPELLRIQTADTYALANELLTDGELNFLLVQNDYFNLKAILKCRFSDAPSDELMLSPSLCTPDVMEQAIREKEFFLLPDFMQEAAQNCYELLARTGDGQLADISLDTAALLQMQRFAEQSKIDFARHLADTFCALSNIKTALRAAATGRDAHFYELALCDCDSLDADLLSAAAQRGTEELFDYLKTTPYREVAASAEISLTAFEKRCDDEMTDLLDEARNKAFGPDPIIAWCFARLTEIKTVRILLSCKKIGLSAEKTGERVRKLYV